MCNTFLIDLYLQFQSNRQLPVPIAVHVAKVLEHQPEPHPSLAISRTRSSEIVAPRNDGRGHIQCAQGRPVAVASRAKVRYPVSNVCAVRESRAQHAGSVDRWWHRSAAEGAWSTAAHSVGHLAGRAHQGRNQDGGFSRYEGL